MPHSIDSLFRTTMSDPSGSRTAHLKRGFEKLPDHLMIAEGPRKKRRSGSRSEVIIPRYVIAS